MKRSQTALFALTLALFSPISSKAQSGPDDGITIRLYDFAGLPTEVAARARQEADSIFSRSQVRLTWLDCTIDEQRQTTADTACNLVRGPRVLNMRLMPKHMEPADGLHGGIFGFAMLSNDDSFAATANIYVDRLGAICDGRKYRRGVVLGAMIAHEMGHLLLGVGSHSKMGLMTLPWGPKVLTAADQGTLGFTKRESRRLANAVDARTRATLSAELGR